MDIETSRDIITNLIKLKSIDRDNVIDLLLRYILDGYDLEKIIKSILDYDTTQVIRGL